MPIHLSGAGRTGNASLGYFGNLNLAQVLCQYPGTENANKPLPSIEAFDKLTDTVKDDNQLKWLNQWIEPQSTCSYIARTSGAVALRRVLEGIARASSNHKVHMRPRVSAIALSLGLEVY